MMKHLSTRFSRGMGALSLAAVFVAAPVSPPAQETAAPTASTAGFSLDPDFQGVTEHVIVISIDGLRPDAIERFGAETLTRLMEEGSYTLEAQTIFPSKTLPSHTSMLTGVDPEVHGVTWNSNRMEEHGHVEVATIFEMADDAGLHTAAFFSKSKFHHLEREGTLEYSQAPGQNHEHWLATRTVPDAIAYLQHRRPNLMFVHLGEPDFAGHTAGWMSRIYGWAVRRADAGVGALLEAADEVYGRGNYTVIVTADHGGHGRTHGTDDPRDMIIPWITWGDGVERGRVTAPVRTTDTAATVLWLLGVRVPAEWTGAAVASAYTPAARLAAGERTNGATAAVTAGGLR